VGEGETGPLRSTKTSLGGGREGTEAEIDEQQTQQRASIEFAVGETSHGRRRPVRVAEKHDRPVEAVRRI